MADFQAARIEAASIRTHVLELVDTKGNSRAIMTTMQDGGVVLGFVGTDGKSHLNVMVDGDDHPTINLLDNSERTRLQLVLQHGRRPQVRFHDEDGEGRAILCLDDDGEAVLWMLDANQKIRLQARMEKGKPIISLGDSDATIRVLASVDSDGKPVFNLVEK